MNVIKFLNEFLNFIRDNENSLTVFLMGEKRIDKLFRLILWQD
jgi:sRNA-binding regulator protein Hfq